MFVSASTRCYSDVSFWDACRLLVDLEYDKVEIWMDENSDHLKPSEVAANPEGFLARYRENTRLQPIAFCLASDVDESTFTVLSKISKQLRIIGKEAPPAKTKKDRLNLPPDPRPPIVINQQFVNSQPKPE